MELMCCLWQLSYSLSVDITVHYLPLAFLMSIRIVSIHVLRLPWTHLHFVQKPHTHILCLGKCPLAEFCTIGTQYMEWKIFMTLHFQQYNFLIPYLEEFDEYLRCTMYCLNEQCWTAGRQSAHTSTTKVSFCTIILKRCHGQCWSWYSQNLRLPPWVLKHYCLHYTETLLP